MEEEPGPGLESLLAQVREEMKIEERTEGEEAASVSLPPSSQFKDRGQPPEEVMDIGI